MAYFKKEFIKSLKIKGSIFLIMLIIGFIYSSPKSRIIIANYFTSSAKFLNGTVETKNKNIWFSEPDLIFNVRLKLRELLKGTQRGWKGAKWLLLQTDCQLSSKRFYVGIDTISQKCNHY